MVITNALSSISRLTAAIAQRVQQYGSQYLTYGLFGALNAPFYYGVWRYVFKEQTENIGLRLLCCLLCLGLIFYKQWPAKWKPLLPLYWYLTILTTLPFFFTVLLILNHGSTTWQNNTIAMIFMTLLLVDSRCAIILLISGCLLGSLIVIIAFHQPLILSHLLGYGSFLLTVAISIVIGTLFSHNQEKFETLKRQTIAMQTQCQEKNRFIDNMSHDLRTALTGILSVIEADRQQLSSTHPIQKTFDQIYQSGHQIHQFLEQLLTLTQRDDPNAIEPIKSFSLSQLFCDIQQLFTPICQQKGLHYQSETDTSIDYINGHTDTLRHVLVHLVGNAIKFTDQGQIQIHYTIKASLLIIRIQDSGCGIAKEDQLRIFQPLTKLAPAYRQQQYQGTGLGLSLSKKWLQQIGGELTVDSAGKNKGSTFTCRLPIEMIKQHANTHKVNPSKKSSSVYRSLTRLLIVEDNLTAQKVAQILLKRAQPNAIIDMAANAASAIDYTNKHDYDLILMDIGLPDKSGLETTSEIRQAPDSKNRQTCIVAVSAHIDPNQKMNYLTAGLDDAINKPLTMEKITALMEKFFVRGLS